MKQVWSELQKRNAAFKSYVTPIPYYSTQNYLDISRNCIQDSVIGYYAERPTRIDAGNSFLNLYPSFPSKTLAYSGFSNLPPKNDVSSNSLCSTFPTCFSKGLCSTFDYATISANSLANGIPIVLYEDASLIEGIYAIKKEFKSYGVTVESVYFVYNETFYSSLISEMSQTNPDTKIMIAPVSIFEDPFCDTLPTGPYPVSDVTLTYQNWGVGFLVCPNRLDLIKEFQNTMSEMEKDFTICKLRAKYLGHCIRQSFYGYLLNTEDPCYNWFQPCVTVKGVPNQKEHNSNGF